MCAVLIVTGCDDYPKDAKNTLETIKKSQIIRVGLIEHKPWAYKNGSNPYGIEVDIASNFAQSLEVQPHWEFLSEAQAIEKLKHHNLDLVIGGLTQGSPRKKEVGFTRPYLKTGDQKNKHHVMAAPRGENRFITTLEKFLKARKSEIEKIYEEEQAK
jgi:ABC-type amino acid transport substrate-binding protein